jgi:hypothetical protein
VAETIDRLLCCGFQCSGKAMRQVYQCWWRICQEIIFFFKFKYHMFYVLYQFVTYLLSLPHMKVPFYEVQSPLVVVRPHDFEVKQNTSNFITSDLLINLSSSTL